MRRTSLATIPILSLTLLVPSIAAAQGLSGTVAQVSADNSVQFSVSGNLVPVTGDSVRIRFANEVEGVGVVWLRGSWRVAFVDGRNVTASPVGETAKPQLGQIAVAFSSTPRRIGSDDAEQAAENESAEAEPVADNQPVEAVGADTSEPVHKKKSSVINKRRYFTVSVGATIVGLDSDAELTGSVGESTSYSVRVNTFGGIMLTRNLAVGGEIGIVNATNSAGTTIQEGIRGPGVTWFFGSSPTAIAGDISFFASGAYVWIDHDNGFGDPATGNGTLFGFGGVYTIRRTLGFYVRASYLTFDFDKEGFDLDHSPFEMGGGLSIFL